MKQNTFVLGSAILLCMSGLITSCTKVDVAFGDSTITDPNISYIDTISYELNTVQSDSFVTSQTGAFLAGRHSDKDLGIMEANTYMHIGTPGIGQVPDAAIYDSAKIWVQANGNYYGDTAKPFTLNVCKLTSDLDLDGQTYFFNKTTFTSELASIASLSNISIRPALHENLGIPVNNSFASDLFAKLKSNSDVISDNEHFYQYVKGITIRGTSANDAVYSFNCADSNVYLRIYYHTTNPNPVNSTVDFKYVNDNLQFNHIETDRSLTSLNVLVPNTSQKISSTLTGNKSVLQTAGGLTLRIDLPFLRNFKTENVYQKILRAEMYVRPYAYNNNYIYRLPSPMTLRKMTEDNVADSVVLDNVNLAQQSVVPVIDNLYGDDNYYAYDITSYVNAVINGASEQYEGLTFESPAFSSNNGVDRLILANNSLFKSVVIKIYRLTL